MIEITQQLKDELMALIGEGNWPNTQFKIVASIVNKLAACVPAEKAEKKANAK